MTGRSAREVDAELELDALLVDGDWSGAIDALDFLNFMEWQ
jgi:hypothetical protein